MYRPSLAEKPKVGELQMDWLRSEDLKEVKVITALNLSITLKCSAHDSAISRCASESGSEESWNTFFTITGISNMWELHRFCKFDDCGSAVEKQ
jgi:hypothetical protein